MGNSHVEVKAENRNEEDYSPNPSSASEPTDTYSKAICVTKLTNLYNPQAYDLNFYIKCEASNHPQGWSTDASPVNMYNMLWNKYFGTRDTFEVNHLANICITESLAPYGITSKLVSEDKFTLGELKLQLCANFDPDKKGTLHKSKFYEIMNKIGSDNIYFEKMEMTMNEQLFHKNHQFDNITGVYERFVGDLRSAGIDFTEPEAKEECLIQYLRDHYQVIEYTIQRTERDLIFKSPQMPLAFGFKKYNNGHYWGSFKGGKREGYGVYKFYEEKQSHFGYWLDSRLLRNIILKFHGEEGEVSELWVGNLNEAVQLDGYSALTIYHSKGGVKWSKQGRIKEGKIDGYGVYQYSNGDNLKGFMKRDKREGFSQYFWTSGSNYLGYWKQGFREGYGEYYYDSKDVYKGFWRQGMFEGWGFYEWAAKNDCYEGEWRGHVRQGYGRYRYEDGRIEEGLFVNNQLEDRHIDSTINYKFKYILRN